MFSIFDMLPSHLTSGLVPCDDRHGALADGTLLPFHGLLQVEMRVRSHALAATFMVADIKEDAILAMPFLVGQRCVIDYDLPYITLNGKAVSCTDRHGRRLHGALQALRTTTIPAHSEQLIPCRVPVGLSTDLGLVLGDTGTVRLAASISKIDGKGRTWARCLNYGDCAQVLPAGKNIGIFQCVNESEIEESGVSEHRPPADTSASLPEHLRQLYGSIPSNSDVEPYRNQIVDLLSRYADVFSSGDQDTGRTNLVQHDIPVLPDTRPIRQPARRLGPEKEAEVERQVKDLEERGLIEPANSAWSSPVVLVRKKDQQWRFCVDYRRVNSVTKQDAYPLPRIDDILDNIRII